MQFPDRIDYRLDGADFALPRMFKARQLFKRDRLEDIEGEVKRQLDGLSLPDLKDKRVCLTAGSRGVANQARILKAVADQLKTRGAKPFVVPAMGSHGGATAEGQLEMIHGYGITEEYLGVPILSDMAVVKLGVTASGFPVYCDAHAHAADYILPVHRIKPHSEFKGPIESGLCKMLVIGLGKHKGCSAIHNLGQSVFATLIPEAAKVFLATGKILAGVAIVENAYDETMLVEAVPAENIHSRETELLTLAKEVMAKFHTDAIDVLIIEEVGKDISGAGMDSNITGRPTSGEPGFEACPIRRIAVLGISELSHGNAAGVGVADLVTVDFMKRLDLGPTYTNHFASRILEGGRMPVIVNSDANAVRIGIHCAEVRDPSAAKVVQVVNTLMLGDILMSEAYLPLIKGDSRFEILSEAEPMRFDDKGRLARLPRGR